MSRSMGFWAPGRRKVKAEAHTSTNRIPWGGGVSISLGAGGVSTLWRLGGPLHSGAFFFF